MKVYEQMLLVDAVGKFVSIYYLKWNKKTKTLTTDFSTKAKITNIFTYVWMYAITIESFYAILSKPKLSKEDILYVCEILMVLPSIYYLLPITYSGQETIKNIFERFDLMDEMLTETVGFDNKKSSVNKVVRLRGAFLSFASVSAISIAFVVHFAKPELKVLTLQGILTPFGIFYITMFGLLECILTDRLGALNKAINKTIDNNYTSKDCHKCNNRAGTSLCPKHLLRTVNFFTGFAIETCSAIKKPLILLINTYGAAGTAQAPVYFMYMVKQVFGRLDLHDILKMIIVDTYIVFSIFYVHLMARTIRELLDEIHNVGKLVHKLYCKTANKEQIKTDVIAISLHVLQEKPHYLLYGCVEFDVANVMEYMNEVLLFSIMLLYFNLTT